MKLGFQTVVFWTILGMLGAATSCSKNNNGESPLSGHIQSPQGEPLAGIPIRAHLQDSNIAVTVFTNKEGHYYYRNLRPGNYKVDIELAGFEPIQEESINIVPTGRAKLDLTLQPKEPSLEELTTAEILLAMPGTDKLKVEAADCSDCHSLQFALRKKT